MCFLHSPHVRISRLMQLHFRVCQRVHLASSTRHLRENQVFPVLQAITFQTAALRLFKCRLSISGKEAEARKGPKSYPAARPFKSFPASFSTPFLDCRVITNFSSSLAFSAAFGARSEKENPLFNSREVKRSTYFL